VSPEGKDFIEATSGSSVVRVIDLSLTRVTWGLLTVTWVITKSFDFWSSVRMRLTAHVLPMVT